jgi:hypothetical protein
VRWLPGSIWQEQHVYEQPSAADSNASNQWAPRLHGYALALGIFSCRHPVSLDFAPLVMRGAELGDILHELVKFILVIGFFYAMLDHATEWGGPSSTASGRPGRTRGW